MSSKEFSKQDEEQILIYFSERTRFIENDIQLVARFLNPKLHCENNDLTHQEFVKIMSFLEKLADEASLSETEKIQLFVEIAVYKLKINWATETVWASTKNLDGLSWWKAFFPEKILTRFALKFLSLPATTASCERNLKTFANIKTKKRNRLLEKRTEKLVFIKFNLKYAQDKIKTLDDQEMEDIKKTERNNSTTVEESVEEITDEETFEETDNEFDVNELICTDEGEDSENVESKENDEEMCQEEIENLECFEDSTMRGTFEEANFKNPAGNANTLGGEIDEICNEEKHWMIISDSQKQNGQELLNNPENKKILYLSNGKKIMVVQNFKLEQFVMKKRY